ncbi:MAG: peptidoglycan-binding protein [Acidimicrobiales bacterium]
MERRRLLAAVAAVAVASTGVGWVAGQRIKSPAEIASETAPPTPSLITVPVESRVLSSTVIVRGTVTFDEQTDISVTGAGASGGSAIITRVPLQPGDQLTEGAVLAEISGRPVIALQGDLPVFRNLTPGLQGPDVAQLEAALIRLGYDPGSVDTNYDAATETAVEALYRDLGYAPKGPTFDETTTLEAAQDRVRGAQESLRIAEASVRNAGVANSTRLQLDRAVAAAEQQLAIVNGQSAIARTQAAETVAAAQNAYNIDPSPDNAAYLRDAQANEVVVNREQDLAINDATAQLDIARALRAEGLDDDSAAGAQRQLDDARAELADANDDLARLDALIGVSFPAGEVVFLPMLPRQVQAVPVVPGDALDGPVMTVSGSGVVIDSAISVTDRALVEAGAEAIVDDDGLGIRARATITVIADNPGGDASNDRYAMRLEPLDPLPDEAVGRSLRVSIPIESTGGEVLAVPLAALSAGPGGDARVEVERSDGTTQFLAVTPGLRAEGYVELSTVSGGELRAGDRVVVGRDLALPVTDGDG